MPLPYKVDKSISHVVFIALAKNEAEIAGVLAQEIGHITARHLAQRYSASKATRVRGLYAWR